MQREEISDDKVGEVARFSEAYSIWLNKTRLMLVEFQRYSQMSLEETMSSKKQESKERRALR
jgi:hypothetical protein